MINFYRTFLFTLTWIICLSSFGQQVVDSSFVAHIVHPAYEQNKGPRILIDEAHNNGGVLKPSFTILSETLKKDGYRVSTNNHEISRDIIQPYDILVIVDPLAAQNIDNWQLPTPPVFKTSEVKAIKKFVNEGGSLFLAVDHMPFPGASQRLAQVFGINFINGFAIDTLEWDLTTFSRKAGSLRQHPIIEGRNANENISEVGSYFGQCFTTYNVDLTPMLVFNNENIVCYLPRKAWIFNSDCKMIGATGLDQGLAGKSGKGRLVILGDSSLAGAYLIGKKERRVGMNSIEEKDNLQFVLNIFHWLSGLF